MTKVEALTRLEEIRGRLLATTEDILDDGSDTGDAIQNARYNKQSDIINDAHKQLASIDIDGIDRDELNNLWAIAWGNAGNVHLPEVKYNHAMRYISELEATLNR